MSLNFNFTGEKRKKLVSAISEILNAPTEYLGAPTFAYHVGEYTIDKNGTLTGPDNSTLIDKLAERGFQPEAQTDIPQEQPGYEEWSEPATAENAPETPDTPSDDINAYLPSVAPDGVQTADVATEAAAPDDTAPVALAADNAVVAAMLEPLPETPPADTPDDDLVVIEVPLDGFDPAKLENLRRLVDSKAALIKKALRADDLPIHIEDDKVVFPWFKGVLDNDTINAYAQFVAALCETAKKKTRVVAKDSGDYENERFSMRLFTVGIGLIGPEYRLIRKLLTKPMDGNGAWRYGDPKKRTAEPTDIAAEEVSGDAVSG